MPKQTVIKHPDWWKYVKQAAKPKHIDMPAQPFEFTIDFTKEALAALDKDPVLQARIWDAAQVQWKAMLNELKSIVKQYDGEIAELLDEAEFHEPKSLEARIKSAKRTPALRVDLAAKKYEKKMKAAVENAWAKIQKEKKDLRGHKIKTGFKMAVKAGAMVLTGLSLFFSGGTNGLAWYALFRQVVSTAKNVRLHFKPIEKLMAEVDKDIQSLSKQTQDHPILAKGSVAANAVTVMALGGNISKTVIGTRKKVIELRVRRLKMMKDVRKLSVDLNKLMTEVKKDKKKAAKAVQSDFDPLEKALDTALKQINATMATANKMEKVVLEGTKALNALDKAQSASAIHNTVSAILVVGTIARVAAMDLSVDDSKIEAGMKAMEKAGEKVKAGIDAYSKSLASTLKAA